MNAVKGGVAAHAPVAVAAAAIAGGNEAEVQLNMYNEDSKYFRCLLYMDPKTNKRRLYPFNPHRIIWGNITHTQFGSVVNCTYRLVDTERGINTVLDKIYLQLPKLKSKFGVAVNKTSNRGDMSMPLELVDGTADTAALFATLQEFDNVTKAAISSKKKEWLSMGDKVFSDEVLFSFYNAVTRDRVSKKSKKTYPPQIGITYRADSTTKEPTAKCYDHLGNPINPLSIGRDSETENIVSHNGLWFTQGERQISHSWKAEQTRRCPTSALPDFAFVVPEGMELECQDTQDAGGWGGTRASSSAAASGFNAGGMDEVAQP